MKNSIIILFILTTHTLLAGGGWTREEGSGFYKIGQFWIISDEHFTSSGGKDPNGTRGTFLTSIYAEYGFTDRITGIVYFPFFARSLVYDQVSETTGNIITEGEAINSVGDADLTFKYGLIQNKPMVVSASLTFGIPLGEDMGGSDGSLQTGDGEFNQQLTIDVSRSFKTGKFYPYLSVYSGFNNRTRGFSDEFRYGFETGITINKWTIIGRLVGVESLKNGESNFNSSGTSLFGNNASYLSISPEISYNMTDKTGISFSYYQPLRGELIFSKPAYSFSVFLNM
jgi:hypothetical protein